MMSRRLRRSVSATRPTSAGRAPTEAAPTSAAGTSGAPGALRDARNHPRVRARPSAIPASLRHLLAARIRRRGRDQRERVGLQRSSLARLAGGVAAEPRAMRDRERVLTRLAEPDVVVDALELLLHLLPAIEVRIVRSLIEPNHQSVAARAATGPAPP